MPASEKVMTFTEWLKSKNIKSDDKIVPLLIDAWNQALFTACEEFGMNEGMDYGIERKYHMD